jgi:KaiC/GvpD/RAD55 family RecA-like ATPase
VDAAGHGKVVLGAIFGWQQRRSLDHAIRYLQPVHFTDPLQANLFAMAVQHMDRNHVVLTRAALEDGLRAMPPGTAAMYCEYYDAMCLGCPPPTVDGLGAFTHSVYQLQELAAERMTGDTITKSMEILRKGMRDGQADLYGHSDARTWLISALSQIDRDLNQEASPEGDIRRDGAAVLTEYARRKALAATDFGGAISTGVPELDRILGSGLEKGELDLIVGWTSSGKTSFIVQLAWHAAVMQGKHVVFFTSETLRPQVRIKILSRHSRLEKFGLAHGLDSADIKGGRLTPAGEEAFAAVITDFSLIAGTCNVVQLPRGATVSMMEAKLARVTRDHPADLVVVDSLQLLRSEVRRRSQWEETSGVVKDAKQVAATYHHGAGVPLVSPWQVSKEARRAARERGFYISQDLAESHEAATSSDLLISLLEPEEFGGGRNVQLQLGIPKNRDGAARFGKDSGMTLQTDYATSYFHAVSGNNPAGLLELPPGDPFGGDGLA